MHILVWIYVKQYDRLDIIYTLFIDRAAVYSERLDQ